MIREILTMRIQDVFEVGEIKDTEDYSTIAMKCKSCNTDFIASTHLLFPENVVHDLGKSTTVICPKCSKSYKASKQTNALAMVKASLEKLYVMKEEAKKHVDNICIKVKALDTETTIAGLECTKCNHLFESSPKTNLNAVKIHKPDGGWEVTITCPNCKAAETVNSTTAISIIVVARILDEIEALEKMEKELIEEIDNA